MSENLAEEGQQYFREIIKTFQDPDVISLMLRKGSYPYSYVTDVEKFKETKLPERECFYNELTKTHISDKDYHHALKVWDKMKIDNLGSWHDLYMTVDVLLLADCFERFRDMCLEYYSIDPCYQYSAPGLSLQAGLRMTDCSLQLLTDPDMHLMFESGVRGGISVVSKQYAKANNKHLSDYDPGSPSSYITYLDANNLYGWAMSQPLPVSDFKWLTQEEIEQLDITRVDDNADYGYCLDVDLHYPEECHHKHNCYPLAPEAKSIPNNMLSNHNEMLWGMLNPPPKPEKDPMHSRIPTTKLITSLEDKENYILHYRNLKLYLRLGMKLKKINRVIRFKQQAWLKTYIDFNTEKRKMAKNEFEKNFFKLMNNSIFGKMLENVRKHVNINLAHTEERLYKQTSKSSFKRFNIFNEDLVGIEHKKVKLHLNKPVCVGQTILDVSKTLMYEFHYDYIKQKYGEKATLLMTDTDSLLYEIHTTDVYQDMFIEKQRFDLSNFPTEHKLHDTSNKKMPGLMKDETAGTPIDCFVGARSKMYAFQYGSKEKLTAKGVCKTTIEKDLRFQHYKDCLFNNSTKMCDMTTIRSEQHQLYVQQLNKRCISTFNDKRYQLGEDFGFRSLAYGNCEITSSND